MKNGWEIKQLGEVCDIVNGSTPLRANKDFWYKGNFPWFTIDDIREQGRIITETKQKVTELALGKLRVLPIDTILLCCTASIGEFAITKIELTTNQQFNGLVIKNKKEEAALRQPQEILAQMKELDAETGDILESIANLIV